MPNDWIELASVEAMNQSGLHRFVFRAGAADKLGNTVEIAIAIIASAIALDDREGVRIRD
jgi:hypothetical protein